MGGQLNMANETVNQETVTVTEHAERTFTQAELDQIVQDRLLRERNKYADYDAMKEKAAKLDEIEEASKSELQKAQERAEKLESELTQMKHEIEVRQIRDKVAQETGVPATLLNGDTEDACAEQAKAIIQFKSSSGYPVVRDRGETQHITTLKPEDQFKEWFNANFK
jgi:hypothetical protein